MAEAAMPASVVSICGSNGDPVDSSTRRPAAM
jgi:hypothetical protein